MDLTQYVRDIPDFPKPGILFKDISPLLANPAAFAAAIEGMAKPYRNKKVDAIAAAEARGFVFAAPLALALQKPFVMLRKPGKLPYSTISYSYTLEYGTAELHVHTDAIHSGSRVLLVDDLLATGGTMQAARHLVEKVGGEVTDMVFLIELSFLEGRAKLAPAEVFSLITY